MNCLKNIIVLISLTLSTGGIASCQTTDTVCADVPTWRKIIQKIDECDLVLKRLAVSDELISKQDSVIHIKDSLVILLKASLADMTIEANRIGYESQGKDIKIKRRGGQLLILSIVSGLLLTGFFLK